MTVKTVGSKDPAFKFVKRNFFIQIRKNGSLVIKRKPRTILAASSDKAEKDDKKDVFYGMT